MEDGRIKDSQISASSEYSDKHKATNARLNRPNLPGTFGAWASKTNDPNQWIQVDLIVPRLVAGVIAQGRYDHDNRVTKYVVSYSEDGSTWQFIKNADGQNVVCMFIIIHLVNHYKWFLFMTKQFDGIVTQKKMLCVMFKVVVLYKYDLVLKLYDSFL